MALARALAVDPEVLLLDEPFGALDAKVRAELRLWLRRLHQEVHVTTVLVTHDQEEALDISDRIAVLHQGRIQQVGTPEELYDHPASTFVMTFLGHVSTIAGRLVRPHDVVLERLPEGTATPPLPELATVGTVRRVVRLGFEVRVELVDDATGAELVAQLTRGETDHLHLLEGDRVVARATRVPDLPPVAQGEEETCRRPRRARRGRPPTCRPRWRWASAPEPTPHHRHRPAGRGVPGREAPRSATAGPVPRRVRRG